MPASPVITEAAIANFDRLNMEASFMKPDEQLHSHKELYTDEHVR